MMTAIKTALKIQCWHSNRHKRAIKILGEEIGCKQKRKTLQEQLCRVKKQLLLKVDSFIKRGLNQIILRIPCSSRYFQMPPTTSGTSHVIAFKYINQNQTASTEQKLKWVIILIYCNAIIIMLLQHLICNFNCIWQTVYKQNKWGISTDKVSG